MGVGSISPLVTVSLRIDLRAVDRARAARALSAD
jgi:pyruvate/2-oxoglutarate dehydrogenase complex dihydrolipoamide acyltransferase (E2) component